MRRFLIFAVFFFTAIFVTKAQYTFEEQARKFRDVPYVAGTLDRNETETLVINLNEVDCTTFLEYLTAAVITGTLADSTDTDFRNNVQKLRYSEGRINGYASRLHYFSEWIEDNTQKGLISEITEQLGGKSGTKEINFMSSHPQSYTALKRDSSLLPLIRETERKLSSKPFPEIKKNQIRNIESGIRQGDLIAITTSIQGLDISHVGFAWFVKGRLHLLHASSSAKKVIIDPLPLSDYLQKNKRAEGIRVLRIMAAPQH